MTCRMAAENLRLSGHLVIKKYRAGREVWRSEALPNKVVSSAGYGRNLILRALIGDGTYPIVIDSAALGDDNTAAADANTALGNQLVADIPITNMTVANNVATIDVFVADANLPDDTYEEFGLFANGRLVTRIIVTPAYSKGTGEDTLFTYTLTLTG